ncbi:zinc finger protein 862-like [Lingula anatina]|uniref:Zinc finger protein 862-like n=1 Tax=Lingula anatina TaxID=7574 RepID=A0A1S3IYJ8_LINAN|nr:zinc finger protein 862-like [Lingula anatina]|eukprot:XP_013403277.1 zinc finger protein 862-like [Lingula anatina]
MYCSLCVEKKKDNIFFQGTNNFRTSTLMRHETSADHKLAIQETSEAAQAKQAFCRALEGKDGAIMSAMKSVYWLVQEGIAIRKFGSLIELLRHLDCPNLSYLDQGDNAKYNSDTAGWDMVAAIAATVEEDLLQKMKSSPFLTILADESTDITVTKKLVICVRLLDDNFVPSTHFVADINVTDGKGATVAAAIKDHLKSKEIPLSKIYGFGSDGAASMTSMGNGVAGRLLAENPAMVHIHCIAHRLALCTSQAANAIDYMKDYQSTITSIFYYFKASSVRVNRITAIQELLDEPILKCNEVHEVRWLPYYKAIETIYRTYGS